MPLTNENGAPAKLQGKYAAMVVCWLLGNGCLFSWNSMLTIEDYYVTLFPLDLATYGKGGIGTYIGLCVISGAFGVADALAQGGMVGDLSFMLPEFIQVGILWLLLIDYSTTFTSTLIGSSSRILIFFLFLLILQSFLAGLAGSGALTSGLRLITKAAFENSKDGLSKGASKFKAFSLFSTNVIGNINQQFIARLQVSNYLLVKKNKNNPQASEGSKTVSTDLTAGGIYTEPGLEDEENPKHERLSSKELFFQNIDYAIDLFLIYALTLSIFPGFLSEDTGPHSLGAWYALVLIAMFNVWDLIGRYVPLIKCVNLESRRGIMIAVLSRFLLVPAFYITAKYGDQGWMIMLTSFFGLSNGYLTVCVLTSAPKGYKGPEQNALGNILVLLLKVGIFAGVTLDWLWLIGKGW
ncbi:hypothetical protein U1Q18_045125 [Sarracenia purpurea var. burkii]